MTVTFKRRGIALLILAILLLTGCSNGEDTVPPVTGADGATADPGDANLPPAPNDQTGTEYLEGDEIDYSLFTTAPKLTLEAFPILDGSTACIPLMENLMRLCTGCTEAEAEERVTVSTTDYSYHALKNGEADLLLVYPPSVPTDTELDVFNTLNAQDIGRDALVFIVNDGNTVEGLTTEQLRDIYSGKVTDWSAVGGSAGAIMPFQRPELSGSQTLMLRLVMSGTAMMPATEEVVAYSMSDVIEDIASYDGSANAIGYNVFYYAKNMYTLPGLKFLSIDGIAPTDESIRGSEYPFIDSFYAVTRPGETGAAKELSDWLATAEGQSFVSACGYVPAALD